MSVSYKKLFDIMEKRGLKKYWLRQNGINPKVVDALKNNKNVNVLCDLSGYTKSKTQYNRMGML